MGGVAPEARIIPEAVFIENETLAKRKENRQSVILPRSSNEI